MNLEIRRGKKNQDKSELDKREPNKRKIRQQGYSSSRERKLSAA